MARSFQFGVSTVVCVAMLSLLGCAGPPVRESARPWTFAVSGDSRNCGNVVMPAIAEGAKNDHAAFYWHLGDLRAIYKVDEDFAAEDRFHFASQPPTKEEYLPLAWPDFTQHQVNAFGSMPFFLGIGNHETIQPKTVDEFRTEFAPLLDRPELHAQRLKDAAGTPVIPVTASNQTYFHWTQRGVDFINLDNATHNAFDDAQVSWFDAVLARDLADATVRSIVVGMHEALPYSRSNAHSMCDSADGMRSGLHVYGQLIEARKHKPVYVLASHSHYYMADIFNTRHWNDTGKDAVLPGWIVGTAGAVRYALPPNTPQSADAREKTYGYLIGTVAADSRITFSFRNISKDDLLRTRGTYTEATVDMCWDENSQIEAMRDRPASPSPCQ